VLQRSRAGRQALPGLQKGGGGLSTIFDKPETDWTPKQWAEYEWRLKTSARVAVQSEGVDALVRSHVKVMVQVALLTLQLKETTSILEKVTKR
jgi:hypothetical protein